MTLAQQLSSQFTAAQNLDFILRLICACLCGATIGIERTRRLKEAGVRTHVILCCASALTMIVSKYGFADLETAGILFAGTRGADPSRIAAQTVSGVSFLGAGVIFKHGNAIRGLTTAAGLWATAGIGLAAGAGMYLIAILATVILTAIQVLMHRFTLSAYNMRTTRMCFTIRDDGETWTRFTEYLQEQQIRIVQSELTRDQSGTLSCDVVLRAPFLLTPDHFSGVWSKSSPPERVTCSSLLV